MAYVEFLHKLLNEIEKRWENERSRAVKNQLMKLYKELDTQDSIIQFSINRMNEELEKLHNAYIENCGELEGVTEK
jgi:hypothetical protein